MRKAITSFTGKYAFLSNFYRIYDNLAVGNMWFENVEAAYQASKTLVKEERTRIQVARTPGTAKKLGRTVTLRPDWDQIKTSVMETLLWQKFSIDADAGLKLIKTGDAELIEGNDWGDRFWGAELENGKWVGENHLGKILMYIRGKLQQVEGD